MKKTFKFRIFPNSKQITILRKTLNSCCWLYNNFVKERNNSWRDKQKGLSYIDQQNTIIELKKEYINLVEIHSQTLQDVAKRVDIAFKAFFRRIKSKEKPGYPHFKPIFRYNSFTYPQSGFKLIGDKVKLSKIGTIKIKLHRPVVGKIKTCIIKRTPTNKWFINFICEVDNSQKVESIEPSIGIDMGLKYFAAFSNGEKIDNPKFFKFEEKTLTKAQRKLSNQSKETPEQNRAYKVVTRIHERIANKRHNFIHQESNKIIAKYNTICVEDLSINNMQKDNFRCINKSIGDAAWGMFVDQLRIKAEKTGKKLIKVNPAYTSQNCSKCGNRQKLELSDRIYHCPCCGLSLDRDINAAKNILTLGMQSLDMTVVVS